MSNFDSYNVHVPAELEILNLLCTYLIKSLYQCSSTSDTDIK